MDIQKQLSNGKWVDVEPENVDRYLDAVVARGKYDVQTREQVIDLLSVKKHLYYDTDWYSEIRVKPAPRQPVAIVTVKCDCGHTVEKSLVMNASIGTCCHDCYDRMSE